MVQQKSIIGIVSSASSDYNGIALLKGDTTILVIELPESPHFPFCGLYQHIGVLL